MKTLFRDFGQLDRRSVSISHFFFMAIIVLGAISDAWFVNTLYRPDGVMPAALVRAAYESAYGGFGFFHFSAFSWFPNATWYATLFVLLGTVAAAIALGFRKRWCYWLVIYLILSANIRFPFTINGGDIELPWILLWISFFSWNPTSANEERDSIQGIGTVLLTLFIVDFYFLQGFSKQDGGWMNGGAIINILRADYELNPGFDWLTKWPTICMGLTYATKWIETLGSFFVLIPIRFVKLRCLVVGAFILFHTGMGLVLHTTPLPEIGVALWIMFLPGSVWDAITRKVHLPRVKPPRAFPIRSPYFTSVAISLFFLSFISSLVAVRKLENFPMIKLAHLLTCSYGACTDWNYYHNGVQYTGWDIIQGTSKHGEMLQVDLIHSSLTKNLNLNKPALRTGIYEKRRWSKFFSRLTESAWERKGLTWHLCNKFPELSSISILHFYQKVVDGHLFEANQRVLSQSNCQGPP